VHLTKPKTQTAKQRKPQLVKALDDVPTQTYAFSEYKHAGGKAMICGDEGRGHSQV
jgi:hypothetical protein